MATRKLKTDSPLARRIARSFIHFLDSVEPCRDVDVEGLEVAKECLSEAFKIELSSNDEASNHDSLVDLFSSLVETERHGMKSDYCHERVPADAPSSSSVANAGDSIMGEDWTRESNSKGMSEDELSTDELLVQFFAALEKVLFFSNAPEGDLAQQDRASNLFNAALLEMRESGCQKLDVKNLADTFKTQGNKAMQRKQYIDAIELYSIAIALCEDNAVYYCNRAAALTQIHRYAEAVRDSSKSIEIDPNYSKAYSRLGFAYYAQGNYRDSIDKGFKKALLLDPNNESVKENIRVAEQKLKEEQERTAHGQNSSSAGHSNAQSTRGSGSGNIPPFTSMPFNVNHLPPAMTNMFMNMAGNVYQGPRSGSEEWPENPAGDSFATGPEIRVGGGSFNVNLGDQVPEISGALRSMMQMFSGASAPNGNSTPNVNSQENLNGGAAPNGASAPNGNSTPN